MPVDRTETASMMAQPTVFYRWRLATYLSMFFGWSTYMLVRKTLPSSMQSLIQHQGFTKDDIGLVASSFALSYGGSKFVSSLLSDHFSSRKLFAAGLLLSGVCCVLFPMTNIVAFACALWFITGLVQGLGWAPCAVLLKTWYPSSQMGRWWSVLSSAGNMASGLSPLLILYITNLSNWKISYYMVGSCSFVLGCVVAYSIKDSPLDIGLDVKFNETPKLDSKQTKNGVSSSEEGQSVRHRWYDVFLIPDLWIVSLVYTCVYAVKDGVLNWVQLFLIEVGGRPQAVAAASVGMFQTGGMAGNLMIGYISDLLIVKTAQKCPRAPVLFGLSLCLVCTFHLFRTTVVEGGPELYFGLAVVLLGFLVDSMMALVGLTAMEVVPSHMAGSGHGLACALGQVGGVLSGWPFAHVMKSYGWNTAYWIVECTSLIMVVFTSYLVAVTFRSLRGVAKQHKLKL